MCMGEPLATDPQTTDIAGEDAISDTEAGTTQESNSGCSVSRGSTPGGVSLILLVLLLVSLLLVEKPRDGQVSDKG